MIFPILLALFLYNKPRIQYTGLRARLGDFFSHRSVDVYFLLFAGLLIMGAAVFLSLSRGGIVSPSVAVCIFGVLLAGRQTERGRGLMIFALFSLVLLSVGWFGWDPIFKRFSSIRDATGEIREARLPLWKDSLDFLKYYPVTGTGFGTFLDVYKGYRTVPGGSIYSHAHNDYIELAVEGGVIAVGLAAAFLYSIFGTYRRFFRRRDAYSIYLYMGAFAGPAAILIHSATDFNLHIGANDLYFFFICGLCAAAAYTRIRSGPGATYLERINSRWANRSLALIGAMLVSRVIFNAGPLSFLDREAEVRPEYF